MRSRTMKVVPTGTVLFTTMTLGFWLGPSFFSTSAISAELEFGSLISSVTRVATMGRVGMSFIFSKIGFQRSIRATSSGCWLMA